MVRNGVAALGAAFLDFVIRCEWPDFATRPGEDAKNHGKEEPDPVANYSDQADENKE